MDHMLLLALDTSTEICSVALWRQGEVIERAFPAAQAHGEHLLPMVRVLLAEAGVKLADCDGLAVASGPGSFTGVRIACAAVQGLALGAGLAVASVSTLEAMAEAAAAEQVLACLDARMHEVYWAAWRKSGRDWKAMTEAQVTAPDRVALPAPGAWIGLGSGFSAYPAIAQRLGGRFGLHTPLDLPLAGAVARLAARRWNELAGPPQSAQPLYVRNKVALTTEERAREGWR